MESYIETDGALRDVFTYLHARSILSCGGLKESIHELKRSVMTVVYEAKNERGVTDEVVADLLGISDRWLRMLGDTRPAAPPSSDTRRILLLLQSRGTAMSLRQVTDALRDLGESVGPKRVRRLLAGLVDLGQVEIEHQGTEPLYRAKHRVQLHVATRKQRARAVRKRLASLVATVRSYVHDEPGAACSRYQYRIPKERAEDVVARIRSAVSQILQEEEARCARLPVGETVEYTVLLNAGMGLSGEPAEASTLAQTE